MAYDRAAYRLRGEFARLNFPHLRHHAAPAPLASSVDAKLHAICQSLTKPLDKRELCNKEEEEEEGISKVVKADSGSPSSEYVLEDVEGSSPSSDMSSLEFTLDEEDNKFLLHKYPSWEIDWESILSSQ